MQNAVRQHKKRRRKKKPRRKKKKEESAQLSLERGRTTTMPTTTIGNEPYINRCVGVFGSVRESVKDQERERERLFSESAFKTENFDSKSAKRCGNLKSLLLSTYQIV